MLITAFELTPSPSRTPLRSFHSISQNIEAAPVLLRIAAGLLSLPKVVFQVGLFDRTGQRIGRRAPDKLVVRFTRPARQGIHSRYDWRWKAFFLQTIERPSPPLLNDIVEIGDRSRLVAGNEKCDPLAMLEVGSADLVCLALMRFERDLDGVIEMLHGSPNSGLLNPLSRRFFAVHYLHVSRRGLGRRCTVRLFVGTWRILPAPIDLATFSGTLKQGRIIAIEFVR